MIEDKFQLLKRHICSKGLSDDLVKEIAAECELVRVEPGEYLHRANEVFNCIYLLIHGRINQSILDYHGNVIVQRQLTGGAHIGTLASALGEPAPVNLVVEEPSVLLRLDYQTGLRITNEHEGFRRNFTKMIADGVMDLIMKDRRLMKPATISVVHQSPETRPLTQRLAERLLNLGEKPHVLTDHADWQRIDGVPDFRLTRDGDYVTVDEVRKQVELWSESKRVFFDVDARLDPDHLVLLFQVCQKVLWCVTPENWQQSVTRLKQVIGRVPGWRDKLDIVWLLPGSCRFAPLAPELISLAKGNFKLSFDAPLKNQSRELVNGFERIIHLLRGIRIGIALGGGAARGMTHLGVLKILEKNGIIADMIAGTSVGAMTGIVYASGLEPDYSIDRFASDLKPSWWFRHLPNGGYWYLLFKYRRRKFDSMLRPYLMDSHLEQLAIPVHAVTVDLVSGKPVVRETGDSIHAILESINLPGLSVPINRNGKCLVDGGIVNNVPANLLVANGCNLVIAVSVTASLDKQFANNRPDTPTSKMKKASTIKTILRTFVVQNVNMNSVGVAPADFVIQPNVNEFDIAEFTRAGEMSAIGEKSANEAMPRLKKMLAKLDGKLFPLVD